MIRRNHIESVTRFDRQILRYEAKDQQRESNSKKYAFKKDLQNIADQSFRVTSSNKKYHQYKDWKQQTRTKNDENQRRQSNKLAIPLTEFQTNQNKFQHNLKRNYQNQVQRKSVNFDSLRVYQRPQQQQQICFDQILNKKRYSQHYHGEYQPLSAQVRERTQIQKTNENMQLPNYQNVQILSPNKKKTRYISTQKYQQNKYPSNYKQFTPLFDNTSLQNKSLQKWQKRTEIASSAKAPGKIAIYENSLKQKKQDTFRRIEVGSFETDKIKKYGFEENTGVKGLPAPKMEKGGQQVSEKLKKISQFNDQINQRIKNIISCFETLKGKF